MRPLARIGVALKKKIWIKRKHIFRSCLPFVMRTLHLPSWEHEMYLDYKRSTPTFVLILLFLWITTWASQIIVYSGNIFFHRMHNRHAHGQQLPVPVCKWRRVGWVRQHWHVQITRSRTGSGHAESMRETALIIAQTRGSRHVDCLGSLQYWWVRFLFIRMRALLMVWYTPFRSG